MIRRALIALTVFAALKAHAGPPDRAPSKPGPRMPDIVSEVYSSSAPSSEITTRAQLCIARVVRFDGPESGKSVIASASTETGLVVANSRLDIRHGMMQSLVQSVLTFETHDGRFRLTHSNIKRAKRVSGFAAPYTEFEPLSADGAFSKRLIPAMQEQFKQIAECVKHKTADF